MDDENVDVPFSFEVIAGSIALFVAIEATKIGATLLSSTLIWFIVFSVILSILMLGLAFAHGIVEGTEEVKRRNKKR